MRPLIPMRDSAISRDMCFVARASMTKAEKARDESGRQERGKTDLPSEGTDTVQRMGMMEGVLEGGLQATLALLCA